MRSMLLLTLLVPAAIAAQQPRGTTTRGRHEAVSRGSVARSAAARGRNMGLTTAQVGQLQAALQREGCDPGPIDGVIGARTHSAVACARQKLGVSSDDPNDLLRALGLHFTVSATHGLGSINSSGRRATDSTGGKGAPPTMRNRGDSSQLNPREKATRPPRR